MSDIKIKNVSTAQVALYVPSIRFNRTLMPGRVIAVTPEEYEELTFDSGFSALVNGHYLKVSGVEEERQAEIVNNVFDKDAIEKMLLNKDVAAFARFIPTATEAEKETAVTLAIEHKITHNGISALIKKYCDIDLINAINARHDAEEK